VHDGQGDREVDVDMVALKVIAVSGGRLAKQSHVRVWHAVWIDMSRSIYPLLEDEVEAMLEEELGRLMSTNRKLGPRNVAADGGGALAKFSGGVSRHYILIARLLNKSTSRQYSIIPLMGWILNIKMAGTEGEAISRQVQKDPELVASSGVVYSCSIAESRVRERTLRKGHGNAIAREGDEVETRSNASKDEAEIEMNYFRSMQW
jgi:hypothetical protein